MTFVKNILTEGTLKTPQIDFNPHTGELILSGKSIPENAARVYEPLLTWAEEYIKEPRETTNFRLNLEYFNSSSLIWITKLVKVLSKIDRDDYLLFIHLYFEAEEFDGFEEDELKGIIGTMVDNIVDTKVSIGIKTYGVDSNYRIAKESTILF
jgi:hypothetical protein